MKGKNTKFCFTTSELLTISAILCNTLFLLVIRDSVSYENDANDFMAIHKSDFFTIIQHNPIIGYVYLICAVILVICGLHRFKNSNL